MPARIDRLLRALIAAMFTGLAPMLLPMLALAQTPQWPTAADMERAKKERPFPDIGRIESQPIPKPPRLVSPAGEVDIDAVARAGAQLPNDIDGGMPLGKPAPKAAPSPLRIFVTLAMPQTSLRQLVDQASRSGAVLVLRGLQDQSMMRTLATVRDLIGDRQVAWQIDPEAFTRFGVRQAPTFVLELNEVSTASAELACAPGGIAGPVPDDFVSVAGDVSLDYALEAILRRRPETAAQIDPLLKRLQGS